MTMMDRPFDFLNHHRARNIIVHIRGDKEMIGELVSFDMHLNLILKINGLHRFVRGATVIYIDETSRNISIVDKKQEKR